MDAAQQDAYEGALLAEIVPALGCTEPIAIALAAAKARELLGSEPTSATLRCSGNIIKNAMSVVVPNAGGRSGLRIAVAMGIVGGRSEAGLECLVGLDDAVAEAAADFAPKVAIELAEGVEGLFAEVEVRRGDDTALASLKGTHTHFHELRRGDEVLLAPQETDPLSEYDFLTLQGILEFARVVDLSKRKELNDVLAQQLEANTAIAHEGLTGEWGARIGRTLRETRPESVERKARSWAAAGSDARMSGCALPVMINSGSGNQGITVSMPVLAYACELGASAGALHRALVVANLVAIHQKQLIGRLSAFCGAVSAAAGAAAGIAFLKGLPDDKIGMSIVNTLATSGGIVCDGAKPSCASKISVAVENALCAIDMAERGITFAAGDGIVGDTVEETIRNVGRVARHGMAATDVEILQVMLEGAARR